MKNYSDNELEAIEKNLEETNEILRQLVRSLNDIEAVLMAGEGQTPNPEYRV